jgi:hypothetical protein
MHACKWGSATGIDNNGQIFGKERTTVSWRCS